MYWLNSWKKTWRGSGVRGILWNTGVICSISIVTTFFLAVEHCKYIRVPTLHTWRKYRARICKCLWSPGIDSEESISPAYVAWRAGTTNRAVVLARRAENRFLYSLKVLQIRALEGNIAVLWLALLSSSRAGNWVLLRPIIYFCSSKPI